MLFNSIDFAVFLPVVFILYWFIINKNIRLQNFLIVIASYVFYGWWDWRFLLLIIFSTMVDFSVGFKLGNEKNQTKRKVLLWVSILVNLGLLGFFKYYNFFLDSFITAFSFFGTDIKANSLNIILPVGISFYTFQTLSYTIDVYNKKLESTKDFIAFSAFVSFFPQLVAGPIERASNLLPQFYKKRTFEYSKAIDGMRQILWGLFKKVVIADGCVVYVNQIFENYSDYSGSTLFLGAVLFAFQIYGDFSGYSDIAIGTARLFGFNLAKNFSFPYFSRDIAEFWRRWHISLSTWFREYLYIPLGGSRGGLYKRIRNVFIIFMVSGLWHGANWTFVVWGALNALYFLPLLLTKRNRNNLEVMVKGKFLPSIIDTFNIAATFGLTTIAWVFFRSDNIVTAIGYLRSMFKMSLFSVPRVFPKLFLLIIIIMVIIEWLQRDKEHALQINNTKITTYLRWCIYFGLLLAIYFFGNFSNTTEFIYFQF